MCTGVRKYFYFKEIAFYFLAAEHNTIIFCTTSNIEYSKIVKTSCIMCPAQSKDKQIGRLLN